MGKYYIQFIEEGYGHFYICVLDNKIFETKKSAVEFMLHDIDFYKDECHVSKKNGEAYSKSNETGIKRYWKILKVDEQLLNKVK